ncbi:MAG: hypothetical protein WKF96_22695 [Solirubrobacteraceae bacterium]
MSIKPLTQRRSRELAELYSEYHATLERHIAHRVNAPRALIEDACQAAWAELAARQDIALGSDHARGWLYTVAVREAWALTGECQLTDPLPHWLGQADDDVPPRRSCASQTSSASPSSPRSSRPSAKP